MIIWPYIEIVFIISCIAGHVEPALLPLETVGDPVLVAGKALEKEYKGLTYIPL